MSFLISYLTSSHLVSSSPTWPIPRRQIKLTARLSHNSSSISSSGSANWVASPSGLLSGLTPLSPPTNAVTSASLILACSSHSFCALLTAAMSSGAETGAAVTDDGVEEAAILPLKMPSSRPGNAAPFAFVAVPLESRPLSLGVGGG